MTPEISALIPQAPNIPGPPELMATLLFLTFVLHILMVNAVLGTVLITLFNLFRDPAIIGLPAISSSGLPGRRLDA